jgi:uncharacterized protein
VNFSEDRQSHWAHLITDAVYNDDLVDFSDDDMALRAAKLKRGVVEGSPEWDILYKKYYEEERGKRG